MASEDKEQWRRWREQGSYEWVRQSQQDGAREAKVMQEERAVANSTDGKHMVRIHLDGIRSTVELDGQQLPNVARVQVDMSRREQEVTITLAGILVEIDGETGNLVLRKEQGM